jgi:hypothetical protein
MSCAQAILSVMIKLYDKIKCTITFAILQPRSFRIMIPFLGDAHGYCGIRHLALEIFRGQQLSGEKPDITAQTDIIGFFFVVVIKYPGFSLISYGRGKIIKCNIYGVNDRGRKKYDEICIAGVFQIYII